MPTPNGETRPHAAPAKAARAPTISLRSLARAIRLYSLVVAAFALLAVGAGAATYWFIPLPKMTGSVTYRVAAEPTGLLNTPYDLKVDFTLYKQQQIAILRSRSVLNAALARPGVADLPMLDRGVVGDPVLYLMNNLKVDFVAGPEYMRVSLEGNDGDQLVAVLKAINAAYLDQAVNKTRNRRLARLDELNKHHEKYRDQLAANRNRVRALMENVGSSDPYAIEIRGRFIEAQIGAAQSQLSTVIATMRGNKVEADMTEKALAQPLPDMPDAVLESLVKADPAYALLQKQQAQAAAEVEEIVKTLQPGVRSPRVETLAQNQERIDRELKTLVAKLKPELRDKYKTVSLGTERQKLDNSRERLAMMGNLQQALLKDIEKLIAQRKDFGGKTIDLETYRDDMSQAERMANRVATDIEELKPEIDAPSRVTAWDEEPTAVAGVEGNRRAKYTGMVAGGLLLFGLALVQWLDLRNLRVHTVDEVTAGTGLTVLGTVPRYPKGGRRGPQSATWNHLLTESINTTRTMILSPRGSHGEAPPPVPRTILVTSASSGEGKTSLTTHLAVSLAGAGRKVLLIDSDMRRPAAHVVLAVPLAPGLSEYLTHGVTAADVSQPCQVPGLTVVAAGKWNAASASALSGVRWRDLLALATAEYDFVLIDSPPILPVADALAIARNVDGVLIAVMQDHSRYLAVQAACNRLSLVGARMLGVVMSGATANGGHYYYDRYYSAYKAPTGAGE